MSDFEEAVDNLTFLFQGVQHIDEQFDHKTGQFAGDTDPTSGLPPGEIWVHRGDGYGSPIRAKNRLGVVSSGIPVSIAEHVNPTYIEITGYDYETIQQTNPNDGNTFINKQQASQIESWQFKPGLLGVDKGGGLNLRVLPFWWANKQVGSGFGTLIPVTPTATSGKSAFILVGYDPATEAFTTELTIDSDAPTYVDVETVLAAFPDIKWLGYALAANGATGILPKDVYDLRWFNLIPSLTVTDGITTVNNVTRVEFTGGAVVTDAGGGLVQIAVTGGGSTSDYIHIRDKKTQNTAGGTFTSGSWVKRDLNEEVSDAGGYASISSSQITLLAGTYRTDIRVPGYDCNAHQARFYNTSDSAVTLLGTSVYGGDDSLSGGLVYVPSTYSHIIGEFTIAGTKTFEVQHQCTTTKATNGLGVPSNFTDEVFTNVVLIRVS